MFSLGQIVVDVPDCPVVKPMVAGLPSWVVAWGMAGSFVLLITLIVGIAIVRHDRNEEITSRQNYARQALLEAAQYVKHCPGCGMDYNIEDKLKKVGKT